ncbi:MAG: inositol monophosphatase family protein [Solirubrobacteraceae bacterium]
MSGGGPRSSDAARGPARTPDPSSARLLLAAEHAVDLGARSLRQGRAHIGALIGKGDRDFATDVDLHIEAEVRASLAEATPEIPFLGEEEGGALEREEARWVLDPIDGTINFAPDSPYCAISLSLLIAGQPVLGIVDAPLLRRLRCRDLPLYPHAKSPHSRLTPTVP